MGCLWLQHVDQLPSPPLPHQLAGERIHLPAAGLKAIAVLKQKAQAPNLVLPSNNQIHPLTKSLSLQLNSSGVLNPAGKCHQEWVLPCILPRLFLAKRGEFKFSFSVFTEEHSLQGISKAFKPSIAIRQLVTQAPILKICLNLTS